MIPESLPLRVKRRMSKDGRRVGAWCVVLVQRSRAERSLSATRSRGEQLLSIGRILVGGGLILRIVRGRRPVATT